MPIKSLLFFALATAILTGCSQTASLESPVSLSKNVIPQAEAEDQSLNRDNPDWLQSYCQTTLVETVVMPTVYERERGPHQVMEPLHLTERFADGQDVATCNFDYYFWPVTKEAYAELGLAYGYNQTAWNTLHSTIGEQAGLELAKLGWKTVEVAEETQAKTAPNFSFTRNNETENITEYLDLYLTKDEELMYEMVVVAENIQ